MYNNKVTVEIECQTQFGPLDAVEMLKNVLNFPAIQSVVITDVQSDYKRFTKEDVQANFLEKFN